MYAFFNYFQVVLEHLIQKNRQVDLAVSFFFLILKIKICYAYVRFQSGNAYGYGLTSALLQPARRLQ